jgi:glycosyltransferase involved in cell wall biosynthesis
MIVTPSDAVRHEVCGHLRINPDKVVVVPEAPRSCFRPLMPEQTVETRKRLQIEDDFLLFVGTIEPRKNLNRLVQAFERVLTTTNLSPQLVIAGTPGWLTDELFSYVAQSEAANRIRWTGYLTNEDLCALYSSCRLFIYPSLYEGFGLPPLEAMACGAPVITSRIPSIMEVVGDSARLVNPTSADELAQSIISLCNDSNEVKNLSAAGLRRAGDFSWERTARLTYNVYQTALARY